MEIRAEHPNPQFERKDWMSLNGSWQFEFDDRRCSLQERWYEPGRKLAGSIVVPFCFESVLSGIGDTAPHETVFYKREFTLPESWENKRVLLHFGAVDYRCRVYLNGTFVGGHEGGQTPFTIDITGAVCPQSENEIGVWVEDPLRDMEQPRGKQYWKEKSEGIYYTRTTGIWQSVWLEAVPQTYLANFRCTSDPATMQLRLEGEIGNPRPGTELTATVTLKGELFCRCTVSARAHRVAATLDLKRECDVCHLDNPLVWEPGHPVLFDMKLELHSGEETDTVTTYFGLRRVEWRDGNVFLNGRPCYLRLVLDQGYWPDGIMTAPTDEAYRQDILLAQKMGFNGCRKHQKVEDPRFLYWADRLGFLVWGECGSAQDFGERAVSRQLTEWSEIIARDYNHPSIIGWVPLNESWGVPGIAQDIRQQQFSLALYHTIHALDNTRFVVNNDGWQMTDTDICAVHNYSHGKQAETTKRAEFHRAMADGWALLESMPAYRGLFADDYGYQGQPVLLTEFGGIRFAKNQEGGWGYSNVANSAEYTQELQALFDAVYESPYLAGFCYTQLTDVEQEENGLLYADRTPKADMECICAAIRRWRPHSAQPVE